MEKGHVGLLTLERNDEHIPILDQLFDEFICPLQFYFMAFETLSEVRTVQERVTELQSGESHCTSTTIMSLKLFISANKSFYFSSRSSDVIQPSPSSPKKVFLPRLVPHFRFDFLFFFSGYLS